MGVKSVQTLWEVSANLFSQGPRYEFKSGGATLYTNSADFESTQEGAEGPEFLQRTPKIITTITI